MWNLKCCCFNGTSNSQIFSASLIEDEITTMENKIGQCVAKRSYSCSSLYGSIWSNLIFQSNVQALACENSCSLRLVEQSIDRSRYCTRVHAIKIFGFLAQFTSTFFIISLAWYFTLLVANKNKKITPLGAETRRFESEPSFTKGKQLSACNDADSNCQIVLSRASYQYARMCYHVYFRSEKKCGNQAKW